MAFSAEPGRKMAYSDNLYWRIVWQQIVQDKPYRDITKNLNISVDSLAWPDPTWPCETNQLVLYTTSGRNLKQLGMLARKHLQREGVLILGVLAVHSDMYLSELCLYRHSATGTLVFNSTVQYIM